VGGQFTLLGSGFSVRVQVRFGVLGSVFGVREHRTSNREPWTSNVEPGTEHEHEPRSENPETW